MYFTSEHKAVRGKLWVIFDRFGNHNKKNICIYFRDLEGNLYGLVVVGTRRPWPVDMQTCQFWHPWPSGSLEIRFCFPSFPLFFHQSQNHTTSQTWESIVEQSWYAVMAVKCDCGGIRLQSIAAASGNVSRLRWLVLPPTNFIHIETCLRSIL